MSSSSPVHTLPIVTIQDNLPTIANEIYSGVIPAENIWISCYNHSPSDSRQSTSPSSLHAKVRVILDEDDRENVVLQVREGDVQITEAERREFNYSYAVSSPTMRIPSTKLLFPVQEYADPERSNAQKPHRITAFALASDKSQFATGYLDGSVHLYPIVPITSGNSQNKYPTSEIGVLARGHKSTVTSLRFFPSSRVLLSSGADFTLQIYPADPISASAVSSGPVQTSKRVSSVRTLTAHTRSVTSTAMIGRGRAIISASMDGTFRIWDVSTGQEETLVHSATGVGIGVNRIFLESELPTAADADAAINGVLYAALHDGSFEVMKLDGTQKPRKLIHEFRSERSVHGALNSIVASSPVDAVNENYIAVGSAKGVVSVYHASSYASIHFRRSDASIEDLAFVPLPGDNSKLGLVVATADGLPWIASLDVLPAEGVSDTKISVFAELAGGDVDAVRAISIYASTSGIEVWTAGDDGIVRRYIL
ncbi:hypothetical protein GYMLUDRAFT_173103 [Collybiopsis luxurians FD-317 M1]|uniref:WD40 repeat-like protein n=1 Tax=Collybiopsis luxurians FD-317 M1 TaxID=944289 RepID=A0A0D0B278_9AGAR|nr:hypothetical protein GYMLUDRAFT_173103 [Collybiopsis luxurians FD-317 M1]